jgi:hypothetical protein
LEDGRVLQSAGELRAEGVWVGFGVDLLYNFAVMVRSSVKTGLEKRQTGTYHLFA